MDINHPPAKAGDHRRRHELQVSGEDDQPGVVQSRQQLGRIGGVAQHGGRDPGAVRPLERARVRPIGNDPRDAGNGRRGAVQSVEERLEVRAAARCEHGDPEHPPSSGH